MSDSRTPFEFNSTVVSIPRHDNSCASDHRFWLFDVVRKHQLPLCVAFRASYYLRMLNDQGDFLTLNNLCERMGRGLTFEIPPLIVHLLILACRIDSQYMVVQGSLGREVTRRYAACFFREDYTRLDLQIVDALNWRLTPLSPFSRLYDFACDAPERTAIIIRDAVIYGVVATADTFVVAALATVKAKRSVQLKSVVETILTKQYGIVEAVVTDVLLLAEFMKNRWNNSTSKPVASPLSIMERLCDGGAPQPLFPMAEELEVPEDKLQTPDNGIKPSKRRRHSSS